MSNSFTSSFENINGESSKDFLENLMSQAINQRDKLRNGDVDSDASSDSFGLDEAINDVVGDI